MEIVNDAIELMKLLREVQHLKQSPNLLSSFGLLVGTITVAIFSKFDIKWPI